MMQPRLLAIAGPEQGASYPLATNPFAIGRNPANQLKLSALSVSREHCVIVRQGDDFVIRDLGSHHGTLVNNERVTESALADGDCIQIGGTVLQFRDR